MLIVSILDTDQPTNRGPGAGCRPRALNQRCTLVSMGKLYTSSMNVLEKLCGHCGHRYKRTDKAFVIFCIANWVVFERLSFALKCLMKSIVAFQAPGAKRKMAQPC